MSVLIRVSDVVVCEADGFADFIFSLSAPSTQVVSVNWGMSSGTASGVTDFSGSSGVLSFAAGETTKTLRIAIANDGSAESIESGFLNLSSPVNAVLERTQALLTIVDNDWASGTPGISVGDVVVDEAAGVATFVVRLDKPATTAVSVDYATANGNAAAGSDYVAASGTLAFAAGEMVKTVSVLINNDGAAEGTELFNLVLSAPAGATLIDAVGTARIGASDQASVATPQIRVADVVVSEADGYADFVFSLSAPSAQVVSVSWDTGSSTASGVTDFSGSSGVLSFAAGETTKVVRIGLVNNGTAESTESGILYLFSPVNALLERTQALLTIVDNDNGFNVYRHGFGDDVYQVVASTDIIIEPLGGGTDTVFASASYTLPDNVERLTLTGSANLDAVGNTLKNVLTGNSGNNKLDGKGGIDTMIGGAGNDTYTVTAGDVVTEDPGGGTDTVRTGVSYTLVENVENLALTGTKAIDGIGNTLNNKLTGNAANNALAGGAGNDTLVGGGGNDSLTGDIGSDTFLFSSTLNAATNVDFLADFTSGVDRLQLEDSVFAAVGPVGALAAAAFRIGANANAAAQRIIYQQGTGQLWYDADGSGASAKVLFATLDPGTTLVATDIFVV